jgi:hypothetical protein
LHDLILTDAGIAVLDAPDDAIVTFDGANLFEVISLTNPKPASYRMPDVLEYRALLKRVYVPESPEEIYWWHEVMVYLVGYLDGSIDSDNLTALVQGLNEVDE